MEDENKSGYRLGDIFQATTWGGIPCKGQYIEILIHLMRASAPWIFLQIMAGNFGTSGSD